MMIQWVKDAARYKRDYNPSRFYLIFTKRLDLKRDVSYISPFRKSDHVIMKMEVMRETERDQGENYKNAKEVMKRQILLNSKDFLCIGMT